MRVAVEVGVNDGVKVAVFVAVGVFVCEAVGVAVRKIPPAFES